MSGPCIFTQTFGGYCEENGNRYTTQSEYESVSDSHSLWVVYRFPFHSQPPKVNSLHDFLKIEIKINFVML